MPRLRVLFLLLPLTFIWIIGWGLYWTGSRRQQKHRPSAKEDTVMDDFTVIADVVLDKIRA